MGREAHHATADRIRGSTSSNLAGRRIVLAVSGSIAAVECVKLARELIRRGAEVQAVMSRAACEIIHPNALEFATGHPVVTQLTGRVEHVELCGEGGWGDLLLLAPATANTLGKIAWGIDDTPVTSCASVALSHMPVLACPAMHETMYDNPAVVANVERLKGFGVTFVEPILAEEKAKLASIETVAAYVERLLGPGDLKGQKVLVIAGGTREPLDDVRVLTNVGTGAIGVALAQAAFTRGADVTLWFGHGDVSPPGHIPTHHFSTVGDLLSRVGEAGAFDLVLCPAALPDFLPRREAGKIPSKGTAPPITLDKAPRLLPELRRICRGVLVGFKLESGVDDAVLLERAESRFKELGLDAIVANRLEDLTPERRIVHLLTRKERETIEGSLDEVANTILSRVVAWTK